MKRNTRKNFIEVFLAVFLCLFCSQVIAKTLEYQLTQASNLFEKKKISALLSFLQNCGSFKVIEDLRLFLIAESLNQLGKKEEAVKEFENLLKKFPDSFGARRAAFPYILLKSKEGNRAVFSRLLSIGRSLRSSYQKGRSLEELLKIEGLEIRQKSLLALESLKAYRSKISFFQKVPESVGLFKHIFSSAQSWQFTRDEWFEIIFLANQEGLGQETLRISHLLVSALGKNGYSAVQVIQADAKRGIGKFKESLPNLNSLIDNTLTDSQIKALALKVRGDHWHFSGFHESAVSDYEKALQIEENGLFKLEIQYRFMRSLFKCVQDKACLKIAEELCRLPQKISLLPGHLYEMGLERYDSGLFEQALPFFTLGAHYFPGHYRADDCLGYAIIINGTQSTEGKSLRKRLAKIYTNSFFNYWLNPEESLKPLPHDTSKVAISPWVRKNLPIWKILWNSPFQPWLKVEIYLQLQNHKGDPSFFWAIMELAEKTGDTNQVTAYAERYLQTHFDSGLSAALVPKWVWERFYPKPYWEKVQAEAKKQDIDPFWVLAIMREESHFNPKILSRSNAMGLMQILPSTGKWIATKLGLKGRFNKETLWNTDQNISFGVWYLKYLFDLFNKDISLATSAYNGGQGNIQRKVEAGPFANLPVLSRLDKVPLPETRDYYKKVLGSWNSYHRLYGWK